MKVWNNMNNNMEQEFQYCWQSQLSMMLKIFESVCDEQYQSEIYSREQMCHFQLGNGFTGSQSALHSRETLSQNETKKNQKRCHIRRIRLDRTDFWATSETIGQL
jgi:hypothetical protein